MKSKRAIEHITEKWWYAEQIIDVTDAERAVELAEEDARDRAVMAHCKACHVGNWRIECGHRNHENCQSLADFKKYYDNE